MKQNQNARRAQFWKRTRVLFARSWQLRSEEEDKQKEMDKRIVRILLWFAKRAGFVGFENFDLAGLVADVSGHYLSADGAVKLLRNKLQPPGPQKVTKPKRPKSLVAALFLCAALSQTPCPQPVSPTQGWKSTSSPAYFMV